MKDWKKRLDEYGRLGVYVYLAIWIGTMAVFFVLLKMGVQERVPWLASHAGEGATLGAAWLLAKVVQIPRIGATLAVTPFVARWMGRRGSVARVRAPEAESATTMGMSASDEAGAPR